MIYRQIFSFQMVRAMGGFVFFLGWVLDGF